MSIEHSDRRNTISDPSYRQILVPADDSEKSRAAMDHTISLARAFDGQIHALSVDQGSGSTRRDQSRTDSEELASKAVEEATEQAETSGIPITVSVQKGSSEEEICQYAANSDIDSIVMGTEGRTGLSGAIFASVAEKTVRKSPVPVLTVRYEDEE